MSNLLSDFDWKDYGVKHGLDSDNKCIEHAIRASVALVEKKPSVFDWRRYIKDYPDLQRALGKQGPVHVNDATCHYLNHGRKESRKKYKLGTNEPYVYDFDWKMYDKLNTGVFRERKRGEIVGEWHCFRHWCEYGYKEGRKTGGCKQLVVKTNASISTDGNVNKQWVSRLITLIQPEYKTVDDLINSYNQQRIDATFDSTFDSTVDNIDNQTLTNINKNIDDFSKFIKPYKNILFICSDYPGYGGAATNCDNLSKYYAKTHNVKSIYWTYSHDEDIKNNTSNQHTIVSSSKIQSTLETLTFKPDIIILKNSLACDLTNIFKCPTIFLVPGIYKNELDVHYTALDTIEKQNKYINQSTLTQIRNSTYSFCNSSHTQDILKKWYGLNTYLFCSTFIQFYGQTLKADPNFHNRKYDYGLIVSDFTRKIKNVDKSIEFLKDKQNVILIGSGSSKYKSYGFECVELVDNDKMAVYYKQIKYIVQDGFYESCSNVRVEWIFNGSDGCNNVGILLIQQYPHNFFEEYIHFLTKKLALLHIKPIVFIYSSSKADKKPIKCDLNVEYVTDTNIFDIIVNKRTLNELLILYLPLQLVDDFTNFDRVMNYTSITKRVFLGGIVNHMYEYIDKYNIINTIGYGSGYKSIYPNIKHSSLREYIYPKYEYDRIVRNKTSLKKKYIHIGRYSAEKNQIFLIKAFHTFMKDMNDSSYKLFLIGKNDNQVKTDLNNYILQNNLTDNIVLIEWMSQSDLFDFCIKHIDYNIITSIGEGLSGICLEMMKLGIPTISSNIPCVNEIITNGENGLLFDYHNYQPLLIKNKKDSKKLVNNINEHIDINISSFISAIKKTIDNLPLLEKLTENCLRISGILEQTVDNYAEIFNKRDTNINSDVLFVVNRSKNANINGVKYIHKKAYELKTLHHINYVYLDNLHMLNVTTYNYILLDALALNPQLCRYEHNKIIEIINTYCKDKIVIIVMHDLHWWSFDTTYCSTPTFKEYMKNISELCFNRNKYYHKNITLLKELNVKYFISLYNNKELQHFVEDCNFIDKFFINGYSAQNKFDFIENTTLKYDISLYGATCKIIYPLRNKLYNLIENKNNIKYKTIKMDTVGQNVIEINDTLNASWLAVATSSIYDYTVRKYFEIPDTRAVLICDANIDLLKNIGNNFIYINRFMNNEMLENIIKYYIDNKEILCYLSYNCLKMIECNNPQESYNIRLNRIINCIKLSGVDELEYYEFNKNTNIKFINYYYIKQQINYYEKNCVIKIHQDLSALYNLYIYRRDCDGYCYSNLNEPSEFSDKLLNHSKIFRIKKYKIIDQIYVSPTLSYFKDYLLDNNNVYDYKYNNVPSFFYGVWADSFDIIKKHTDVKVLIFTGGDLVTNLNNISELINNDNTYVMSISKSLCNVLKTKNIRHVYFPYYTTITIDYIFKPIVKKKILYYTSFNPKTYGLDLVLLLEKLLPQYEFYFTSNIEHMKVADANRPKLITLFGEEKYNFIKHKIVILPRDELLALIDDCFIYLRPTENDGLGQLAVECAMKGIKTLNNSIGTSNCINYNGRDTPSIIQVINNEYIKQNNESTKGYQMDIIHNIKTELKHPLTLYSEIYYKNNINYYFDKIYVLNLKRDVHKRSVIEQTFDTFNINNYQIYDAISGYENQDIISKYETYSKIPFTERENQLGRKLIGSAGVLANLISVRNIIIDAKKNNYKRILFMEDDVILHKNFNSLFTDTTSKIDDDWKILYLGVQNILNEQTDIYDNTYNCNINSSGGWSFGIDMSVYDEIIRECNKEDLPFDSGPLHYLKTKYPTKCKVIYPNLCICDTEKSSLRKYKRNIKDDAIKYKWFMDDYYRL